MHEKPTYRLGKAGHRSVQLQIHHSEASLPRDCQNHLKQNNNLQKQAVACVNAVKRKK